MESLSLYDNDPSVKLSKEGDDVSEEWEMPFDITMVDVNEAKKMQENKYIKDLTMVVICLSCNPRRQRKHSKKTKSKVYFT